MVVGVEDGAAVRLEAASKSYGSLRALEETSLQVWPGEILALLGPNGAGKTTAVSLMLGLRATSSGWARIFGRDPREPGSRKRVGAMLQESGMKPEPKPNTAANAASAKAFARKRKYPSSPYLDPSPKNCVYKHLLNVNIT